MKRQLFLGLCISLAVLISACGPKPTLGSTATRAQTPLETNTSTFTVIGLNTITKTKIPSSAQKPLATNAPTSTRIVQPTIPAAITSTTQVPFPTTPLMGNLGPIAFIQGYQWEIGLMDADGSNRRVLFPNPFTSNEIDLTAGLSWSPDGTRLAYATSTWADIFILSVQDSTTRNITNTGDRFETEPAWSPSGNKIAFSSNRNGGKFNIHLMDVDGANIGKLTDCPARCSLPTWSPSGEYIAYVSDQGTTGDDIFVMKADGSEQRRLVSGGVNLYPVWSPDGKRIAFARSADFNSISYLFLVNPDGTGLKALTDDSASTRQASWSPDSRYIVFENFPTGGPIATLWIIELQSGKTSPLTTSSGYYTPAWKPGLKVDQEDIKPFPDCTSGWTRLVAGGQASVMGAPSDPPNRVRSGASKADAVIGQISPGAILQVLEGPVCMDGLVFWKVANATIPGGSGWTAEGDGTEYYLQQLPATFDKIEYLSYNRLNHGKVSSRLAMI
jgi:hypothetical protein